MYSQLHFAFQSTIESDTPNKHTSIHRTNTDQRTNTLSNKNHFACRNTENCEHLQTLLKVMWKFFFLSEADKHKVEKQRIKLLLQTTTTIK